MVFTYGAKKILFPVQMGKVTAKKFGPTLFDKVTGKTLIGCTMESSTVLTKTVEDILMR